MTDKALFDACRKALKLAWISGEKLRLEAEGRLLPEDVAGLLDEDSRLVAALSDDLPQKAVLVRRIELARAALKRGDYEEVKVELLVIEKNWDNAQHDARIVKRSSDGRKGGKKPKRKIWAEAAVGMLRNNAGDATKEQAWLMLPDAGSAWDVETDAADYKVYRDGDKIVGVNTLTHEEEAIAESTFLRHYYRKGQ